MSSRQEEKERRRQERLAREQAERSAAARRKRLQYAFGALLAAAAVAAVVVVIAGAGGNGSGGSGDGPQDPTPAADVKLPQQQTADLGAAAKAAGCVLQNPAVPAVDGSGLHDAKNFKASDYNTNPPASGRHNPDYYEDGIYAPGDTPRLGTQVHTLEHGRIDVQYKPGTPAAAVKQLEALLGEQSGGYHMLLYENTSGMDYAVAATAWGHLLGCKQMNDKVFDAIRTFRTRYIDKGPESVP